MGEVIQIHQKRLFTLEEARELLPVVQRLTRSAATAVEKMSTQLAYFEAGERRQKLEDEVHEIFDEWYAKIVKLGCEAKGMWLVDFDNGEGYFCWRHPEPELEFFHTYSDGFQGRVRIS